MTEHTPTPWRLYDEGATTAIMATTVPAPKNEVVHWSGFDACHFSTRKAKANAAFIVKAVNNHDALVKHLHHLATVCCDEDALRLLDSLGGGVGPQSKPQEGGQS